MPEGPRETSGQEPARISGRQAIGWSVAFLIVVLLVILFFLYGRQVRPMLGAQLPPGEAWLPSSS
ncbi:MAG: hypothetical protein ACHQU8_02925 [Gemmatimonadales bacterium]